MTPPGKQNQDVRQTPDGGMIMMRTANRNTQHASHEKARSKLPLVHSLWWWQLKAATNHTGLIFRNDDSDGKMKKSLGIHQAPNFPLICIVGDQFVICACEVINLALIIASYDQFVICPTEALNWKKNTGKFGKFFQVGDPLPPPCLGIYPRIYRNGLAIFWPFQLSSTDETMGWNDPLSLEKCLNFARFFFIKSLPNWSHKFCIDLEAWGCRSRLAS